MAKSLAHETSFATTKMTLPEVMSLVGSDLAAIEERLASIERPDVPLTSDIMDHVLARRGKRVRPLLLLLVARLGKAVDRDAVLWASTVIELIHTATLLHDDCLDGTMIRRGVATVNHTWGQQPAILMGDYLFTKGFDLLCEHELPEALQILTRHTHRMTCGMNREYAGWHNAQITVDEYLRIIEEKTGALFVASCEIAAALTGLSEEARATVVEFGRDLGYAFQIIDDIFDFAGDPTEIGKPVGTDFRLGFATLPLIHAFELGDPGQSATVAASFARGDVTDDEWKAARAFVLGSGGIEAARQRALEYAYAARERLAMFHSTEEVAPLLATVEYMIARGR